MKPIQGYVLKRCQKFNVNLLFYRQRRGNGRRKRNEMQKKMKKIKSK